MTRSVADAARVLDAIAGTDPDDPYTTEADTRRNTDYTAALDADALDGARIGVLRDWIATDESPDVEAMARFEAVLHTLRVAGAEVIDDVSVAGLVALVDVAGSCRRFSHDIARYFETRDGAPFGAITELLDRGDFGPWSEQMLDRVADDDPDVPPADRDPPCPEFADHEGRQALLAALTDAMDATGVDALVHPSWTRPPAALGREDVRYGGDLSQALAPAAGMPAITVPMGYTYGNRPAGLQFIGRRWDDARLLALAYAFEQQIRGRRPPAGFGPLDD